MSWSTNKIVGTAETLEREIADAHIISPTVTDQEMLDGLHVGKQAAIKCLEHLDKVGTYSHYGVIISGHSNPGHKATPGWANDGVSVSIYGLSEDDLKYWKS